RRRHTRFSRDWSADVCSSDLDHGGRLGGAADTGHPGRPTGTQRHLVPASGVPRRHAVHRERDHRQATVVVAPRAGDLHDRAHRAQSGRRRRRHRHPCRADAMPARGGVMSFDLGPALLFCPADRPERFAGALTKADAVILDLEDAVLPAAKALARDNVRAADLDPARVIVRVNDPASVEFSADLSALARTPYRNVMVAKTEHPAALDAFDESYSLIALCET